MRVVAVVVDNWFEAVVLVTVLWLVVVSMVAIAVLSLVIDIAELFILKRRDFKEGIVALTHAAASVF